MGNILRTRFSSNAEDLGSSANSDNPPEGVIQINDSLYQLYSPPDGKVQLDIVFFHGIQIGDYKDAYWKTWSSDGNTIWPRTLLSSTFPQARMFAVSYDSCVRRSESGGGVDLHRIGEYLVDDVIDSREACVGQNKRPVILVGHSLGGIAIKLLITMAHDTAELNTKQMAGVRNFLRNLCGIFYYATPHGGSRLADVLSRLPGNSDVERFLTTLNKEAARLNNNFSILRRGLQIQTGAICETLQTKIRGVNYIFVEEASARFDTDNYYMAHEDHISICKPQDKKKASFAYLEKFIFENADRTGQKLTVKEEEVSDIDILI